MTDVNNNNAFLNSPEYLQLQEQISRYEVLRKSGIESPSASTRNISTRAVTNTDPSDYERVCPIDPDDPDYRPSTVTGSDVQELPELPFPTLPQHSDPVLAELRYKLLEVAKRNNWHDYDRLPGTAVHGNINSDEVSNNTAWAVRGTAADREQRAEERDFGINDGCLQKEDNWALYDATFRYVSANLPRLFLIGGPAFIGALILILGKLIEFIVTLGNAKFEIIEPLTFGIPPIRAHAPEDLLFYPYDTDPVTGEKTIDPQYPKPTWHEDFENDDVLAHLQTSAETPVFDYFKPYKSHQSNFPITNAQFRGVAGFENDDLDTAMNEGRLYITDFGSFNDEVLAQFQWGRPHSEVPISKGRLYAAIALFAVPMGSTGIERNSDDTSNLKTIAIQPTQRSADNDWEWWWFYNLGIGKHENPPSKIITPADDTYTWKMAKTMFVSMYSMSNVVDHLSTHVYLYPIATSFYANIPKMHPLSALLLPHLSAMAFNNFTGIFQEIGTGAIFSEELVYGDPLNGLLTGAVQHVSGYSSQSFVTGTVRRSQHYHFTEHGKPFDRSQDSDFDALNVYPHHDDNQQTWGAIHEWVTSYINLYYANNNDVKDDTELQEFLKSVAYTGMQGFPSSASTLSELITTVSHIIYWMSVNHALGNLSAFQPMGALGYYSSLPLDPNGHRNHGDWMSAMPRINIGLGLFEFTRLFVDLPTPWHRSLGKYPQGSFMHDPRVYQHLHRFQDEVERIDDELRAKNSTRRWGYDLRMPSTMTCSPWN